MPKQTNARKGFKCVLAASAFPARKSSWHLLHSAGRHFHQEAPSLSSWAAGLRISNKCTLRPDQRSTSLISTSSPSLGQRWRRRPQLLLLMLSAGLPSPPTARVLMQIFFEVCLPSYFQGGIADICLCFFHLCCR